jgi:hypothetical protein
MKQDERRKMLEKFYRARRRGIVGEFDVGK